MAKKIDGELLVSKYEAAVKKIRTDGKTITGTKAVELLKKMVSALSEEKPKK